MASTVNGEPRGSGAGFDGEALMDPDIDISAFTASSTPTVEDVELIRFFALFLAPFAGSFWLSSSCVVAGCLLSPSIAVGESRFRFWEELMICYLQVRE
jgi:hypothetical protein